MPVHDWTRVNPGVFHDFHNAWITEIRNALNGGILPPEYYALGEQCAGSIGPDVLTLNTVDDDTDLPDTGEGGTALATDPPKVALISQLELDFYTSRQSSLVIRHTTGDRIVAMIELLSSGNKATRHEFRRFLDKAAAALKQGYHLLLVDLFPPTPRDPQGIHGALWSELGDESYRAPPDRPLTLAAYCAGPTTTAYIEPLAVRELLRPMPLFLSTSRYVYVPLEETYNAAYEGVPKRWRTVLEG